MIYGGGCVLIPALAFLVINADWQFPVPFLGIDYKPWRFFFIVCGLPGLLSAIAMIFFPESPKFVLNQGDAKQAFKIVQKINRWNNGKSAQLSFGAIEMYSDAPTNLNGEGKPKGLLATVWIQTVPLFMPPYLGPTLLLCTIMVLINATAPG